ncbi:MAG: ribonucleoside triphosphate reductase, partial [Eubacteriales bacterium]|nr:ribonucleoside triphosphate reductase [Eubacteriales bacterium]
QIVNSTFTTQGETAGAQAWSSFDTYCAPFIRYDKLDYSQVKQALQEFIFNINVPTRVGFQCPFSNLTFDIVVPRTLKDEPVIIGGQYMEETYGAFQAEMDLFNQAFCDVMLEGDAHGRVFTFPIPTINVTRDFDWNSPVVNRFMEITCKYGIPYFSNYVNSDLSPEDAVSMCCRLRLDTTELRKRGGGLFGSNPMTGSIGVVTINLPRIGYLSRSESEFKARLWRLIHIAKDSLELKRKTIEEQTGRGLYPYSAHYLRAIKQRTGSYWTNHFNTVGIVGMHEACLNFLGEDLGLTSEQGQAFAQRILNYMRDQLRQIQEETGHFYNLEATPAEGTSYRLAKLDREKYPDITCSGDDIPYYTNSSQLPVGFTDDIFETLDLQDDLQSLYTGGTVLHLYLGERIADPEVAKRLIQKVFENYKLPYISLTPTFSICPDHGYLSGEHFTCPECGRPAEVWSRVVGYLRPVQNYHKGKKEEYRQRIKYVVKASELA